MDIMDKMINHDQYHDRCVNKMDINTANWCLAEIIDPITLHDLLCHTSGMH